MKFSFSRKFDFPPEVYFNDGTRVECISETSLLGVIISDDLKWSKNTSFLCSKARRKLWILRRMQLLDLDPMQLFNAYKKEIRSVLEYAVPVWHSGITRKESSEIEGIQKLAFRIILKQSYSSYTRACAFFVTETLEKRRQSICLKFALKNIKSNQSLFEVAPKDERLRQRRRIVKEFTCNSKRFERSSLPYLASLVNSHQPQFWRFSLFLVLVRCGP